MKAQYLFILIFALNTSLAWAKPQGKTRELTKNERTVVENHFTSLVHNASGAALSDNDAIKSLSALCAKLIEVGAPLSSEAPNCGIKVSVKPPQGAPATITLTLQFKHGAVSTNTLTPNNETLGQKMFRISKATSVDRLNKLTKELQSPTDPSVVKRTNAIANNKDAEHGCQDCQNIPPPQELKAEGCWDCTPPKTAGVDGSHHPSDDPLEKAKGKSAKLAE